MVETPTRTKVRMTRGKFDNLIALSDEKVSLAVRRAHDAAVAQAVGYLEREAGEVRRGRDGVGSGQGRKFFTRRRAIAIENPIVVLMVKDCIERGLMLICILVRVVPWRGRGRITAPRGGMLASRHRPLIAPSSSDNRTL